MNSPHRTLEGKVIVIIGGSTGLGSSAARACVRAGARVVITGRNAESLAAAGAGLGEAGATLAGDARDPDHAPAAIRLARERFGGFHGLYHVAGGSGRRFGDGPLHEITDEGLRATLELNLHSVVLSNRAAVRQFLAQGSGGSVLNLSSVLAWSPSPAHFATHAYAAAKAAGGGALEFIEREMVSRALTDLGGDAASAAKILGITKAAVQKRAKGA